MKAGEWSNIMEAMLLCAFCRLPRRKGSLHKPLAQRPPSQCSTSPQEIAPLLLPARRLSDLSELLGREIHVHRKVHLCQNRRCKGRGSSCAGHEQRHVVLHIHSLIERSGGGPRPALAAAASWAFFRIDRRAPSSCKALRTTLGSTTRGGSPWHSAEPSSGSGVKGRPAARHRLHMSQAMDAELGYITHAEPSAISRTGAHTCSHC